MWDCCGFLDDCERAGSSPRPAVQSLRIVPGFQPRDGMVEQPTEAGNLAAHKHLRAMGLPILLDESVYSASDIIRAVRADAADGVSLYVGKSGGIDRLVQAATIAHHLGLEVVIGSNAEMGIGTAAMLHAAAACPALGSVPSDLIGHHFYTEDTLQTSLDINGLRATPPSGPGLGVELREDIIRTFR